MSDDAKNKAEIESSTGGRLFRRRYVSLTRILGSIIVRLLRILTAVMGRFYSARTMATIADEAAPIYPVSGPLGQLKFVCTSAQTVRAVARWKEPGSHWWVENVVGRGDCVWDVGANIGRLALYSALKVGPEGKVICFEPGADSFSVLCRNVGINNLNAIVSAYCVALSNETKAADFYMSKRDAGAAAHVFGNRLEANKDEPLPVIQSAIGFRGDNFAEQFKIRAPDHIKIDVDSIEIRVVDGLGALSAGVKSMIIETNDINPTDQKMVDLLSFITNLGFVEDAGFSQRFVNDRNRLFTR